MITPDKIFSLDKKGLETLFNSTIKDITTTDIEPSYIKAKMVSQLQKNVDGFTVRAIDYHNNNIGFVIGRFEFKIKVSVKSTGKVVKITKLKSKLVKGVGGFKVDSISFITPGFCFKFDDEQKLKIKIDEEWTSSVINNIDLSKIKGSINDFYSTEKIIELSDIQEQSYIDFKKNRNKDIDDYKGFRYNIELTIAQPVLKKYIDIIWNSNVKKSKLTFIPKDYQHLIPNNVNHTNIFQTIVNIVGVINSELVDDIINKIFPQDALRNTNEHIQRP